MNSATATGHSCTWCLHIIYIKRATTFCNFLANSERKAAVLPTKLLIILDWTTESWSSKRKYIKKGTLLTQPLIMKGRRRPRGLGLTRTCPLMTCWKKPLITAARQLYIHIYIRISIPFHFLFLILIAGAPLTTPRWEVVIPVQSRALHLARAEPGPETIARLNNLRERAEKMCTA